MKKALEYFRNDLNAIAQAGTAKEERIITTPQQ